jgi:hypothetical protein
LAAELSLGVMLFTLTTCRLTASPGAWGVSSAADVAALALVNTSPAVKTHSMGTFEIVDQLVEASLVRGWPIVPRSSSPTKALAPASGSVGFFNEGSSSIGLNSGVPLVERQCPS